MSPPMSPIVETAKGKVRGLTADGVQVFRGLRYGATTGGANRFRAPQPLPGWTGLRDALLPGAAAPQLPRPENTDPFYSWYAAIEPPYEDCLSLNLFTPGVDGGRRPVMVWIHGGGWREFSGSAPGFDGTHLARTQDVVVASITHRLGVFGFLKLDSDDDDFADSGNAGALDIIAALEWVRDNIAGFGGDPANVTLFGESGGASKIAALLSAERARGLFHKAVMQSSGGGMALASPDEATRTARALATALGLQRLTPRALQALPMGRILAATRQAPGPYRGMIDGRTFAADPFGDAAPAAAAGVALMAGGTLTETTYHLRFGAGNFTLTLAQVERRLTAFFETDPATVRAILDAYLRAYPDATPSRLLALISGDFIFKRTTYRMAALQSAQAPVYAYSFDWEPPIEGGRMGAPHTVEVPFIFGTTAAAAGCVGTGPDLAPLTAMMGEAWASFARLGKPASAHLPAWERYDTEGQRMMVLNRQSRMASDPGGEARAALDVLPQFTYAHVIPRLLAD